MSNRIILEGNVSDVSGSIPTVSIADAHGHGTGVLLTGIFAGARLTCLAGKGSLIHTIHLVRPSSGNSQINYFSPGMYYFPHSYEEIAIAMDTGTGGVTDIDVKIWIGGRP